MDFLKWLLKVSFMLALMFLGLKSSPANDDSETDKSPKPSAIFKAL
ncbi:MAG: hypothetical protein JKX72_06195 [Robiginitomaculum sp.]|nr:hypothetical protein [Robiginitomaculum sp.]